MKKPDAGSTSEPKLVVLTDEGRRVHASGILIDGHNDLPWQIRKYAGGDFDEMDISQPQEKLQTDIPRLRQGGMGAQFFVVYVPTELEKEGTATQTALEQFDLIHRMVQRYPGTFEMADTADDVVRIHNAGKIGVLIGVEGGHMIEGKLETLAKFHELGARYLGLTHSETIGWADSATDEEPHGGLTPFGEQVVRELNRQGILVDLAHVSADTMRDAIRVSKAPVISSHSGAYAVAEHARNVPDDVLKMIAKNGGVVMVVFFSGYAEPVGAKNMADMFSTERELHKKYGDGDEFKQAWNAWRAEHPIPPGDVGTIVDHIDYIVKVAGIDHVGLGGDFDGARIMPAQLEDVSGYPYITQELLNRGYSADDVHKIMGGNLLRALRAAERVAREMQAASAP